MSNKTKIAVTMATVISLGGVAWTQSREGTVLKPYYDSVKVATIGTGTTVYPNGKPVKITDPPISKNKPLNIYNST